MAHENGELEIDVINPHHPDKPLGKMSIGTLYFSGQNMNKFRVLNITLQRDGVTPCKKVRLRTLWVERLEQNTITFNWSEKKKRELITWAKTFKMDLITLEKALSRRKWRKNGLK